MGDYRAYVCPRCHAQVPGRIWCNGTKAGRDRHPLTLAEMVELVPAADHRGAVYVIGRLDDALRDVDPEYAGSPLREDEVRPFLTNPGGR